MTRLERNRLKRQQKKRKYIFTFGILMCMSTLIGGVIITNNVMVRMTSLPREQDLFYRGNIVKGIGYNVECMAKLVKEGSLWLEERILWIYEMVVQWIRELI